MRTLLKPHLPEARLGKTIPLQNGWAARIDAYFPSTDAIKGVPEALSSLGTVREVTDKHLETIASWPTHDRVLTVNMRPGMGRLINLDEKRQGCPRTEPPYCGLQLCFFVFPVVHSALSYHRGGQGARLLIGHVSALRPRLLNCWHL